VRRPGSIEEQLGKAGAEMISTTSGLEFAREEDTLIVTLVADPHEADYQRFEDEAAELLSHFHDQSIKNVVLDFGTTDYVCCAAIRFLVQLKERVSCRNGRMALCNASHHELAVLSATNLAGQWSICRSRSEALRAVKS
jgi:anti-anti-sigma factor